MRAADDCHPLPDQLHPCSSFFRFPRTSPCDVVRSRKDRCVFTTPSIASAGGPLFTHRELFVPKGSASSRLSFRRLPPPAGSTFFAWLSGFEENDQDRFFRASVKEGAKSTTRNEFHRWVLELSSLSPAHGFATVLEKKRIVFCSLRFPIAFPRFVSENEGADTGFATASVSSRPRVLRSALRRSHRFAFRFRSSFLVRKEQRPSTSISATESDARARPELPYLLRTSRRSLRTAVSVFHPDAPRAGVPAVRDRNPILR